MLRSRSVSYKELQKQAKEYGIPANMKREFLEAAIDAHIKNDEEKKNTIVQYHKNNRKRRANKPLIEPAKSKTKKTTNDTAVVVLHQIDCETERCHIDLTDDDDNPDDFHPDSTSTPNHHHSYVNRLEYNTQNSSSPGPFTSVNSANTYESRSGNITSFFTSVPAILPRNLAQESFGGDKNVACTPYYDSSVYKSSFLQHSESQLCLYNNSNYNLARENYYPSQSPFNSRYYENNTPGTVTELGFERLMLNTIENECASCLPNVPQLSDVRECSSTPNSSWSQNITVIDNSRTLVPVSANNTNQANPPFECFDNRVTDAGSINAEFDSNSDTESLGLSEEMACLFESEAENENRRPTNSPNVSDFYPRPNVCSEIMQFEGNRSSFANSLRDERSSAENSNRIDIAHSRNSGVGGLTPYQSPQESNNKLYDNNLLPSVSTLLPDYNLQASYQAYVKWTQACYDLNLAVDNASNQFVPPFDKTNNFNLSDDLQNMEDGSLYAKTLENSNYWRNFSTLFGSNNNQFNDSTLKALLGNKSTLSLNDELFTGNSFVTSSLLQNMTVLPLNLIDQVAEEICEINGDKENDQNFIPRSTNSTSNRETTEVVYQHESISIQDTVRDNNITKDVYRESLQIKMNKPVENITLPSLRESTTQIRDEDQPVSSYRPCKNKIYGCVDIFKTNETHAQVHEKECLYQVVRCPLDKCEWCDIMKTLSTHIYESHRADLNIGNDLVYVVKRTEKEDVPFITYFQLYEGTIFVVTLDINEKRCICTMQFLPEVETTDYRNKRIKGVMQLIYFTSKVESKSWKGVVRPYFENDETLFQKGNTLQSTIANSRNIILRVLIK